MQSAQSAVMRKGEFARLRQVSPARVSQWITEGKIFGDAIVGSGRDQRINADLATQQLGGTLDLTQVVAQGRPAPESGMPPMSEAVRRAQDAKAEQAEIDVRRARRKELEEMGVYIRADVAKREWTGMLSQLLASMEELVPMLGDAIAAACQADAKTATVVLRREFRAWRERQMVAAKEIAAAEPVLIEDAVETDG